MSTRSSMPGRHFWVGSPDPGRQQTLDWSLPYDSVLAHSRAPTWPTEILCSLSAKLSGGRVGPCSSALLSPVSRLQMLFQERIRHTALCPQTPGPTRGGYSPCTSSLSLQLLLGLEVRVRHRTGLRSFFYPVLHRCF